MTPRQYLLGLNKPYITLPEVAKALETDYSTFWYRLRDAPEAEKAEANGAFRAGATITFTLDSAIAFAERHQKYWAARQQVPLLQRNAK